MENESKNFQVSLSQNTDLYSIPPLQVVPIKEFDGFTEYKDLEEYAKQLKAFRRHKAKPKGLSPEKKLEISASLHKLIKGNPISFSSPRNENKKSMLFTSISSDPGRHISRRESIEKFMPGKLPDILKRESPKKAISHYKHHSNRSEIEEPKICARCSSLPRISNESPQKKNTPSNKKPKQKHYKYTLERVRKYTVKEPKMPNIFKGCHNPEKIYEKAEYLATRPKNPKFNLQELDQRIETLCKHDKNDYFGIKHV